MKIKLISVCIVLMLFCNISSLFCTDGCLACELDLTGNPRCKTCDVQNFYLLSNSGRCFQRKIENCEIPTADPSARVCMLCKPGHYLDNRGSRCSPVPAKFMIPNCKRYHWEYSCAECKEMYYRSKNRCKPVAGKIENCQVYLDAKTCAECQDGFYYHSQIKKCEAIPPKPQCLVYSSVECTKCKSGHFEVANVAAEASLSLNFLQSLTIYSLSLKINSAFYERKPVNECVAGTVQNCQIHSVFDQCAECKAGFFLSPGKTCELDPVRTVMHCLAYSAVNTCSRCSSEYYLLENVCRSLQEVSGCLEFDTKTKHCLKCDYSKFYMDSGTCGARDKSLNISHCLEVSNTSDECVNCIPSFQLSDDHLKCIPHIPHCKSYVSSSIVTHADYRNFNTFSLRCSSCDDHFYLSLNVKACLPQDSLGCVSFTPDTNDCVECSFGFYLTADACSPYTVNLCKTYDTTTDACVDCFDGYFLIGPICIRYSARNCLTFEAATDNCATCLKQYYKTSSGSSAMVNCEPLTAMNCKSFPKDGAGNVTGDTCDTCYQGYVKEGINCVTITLLNCAVKTPGADTCATCKMSYYKQGDVCKAYTVKNCDVYNPLKDECTSCLDTGATGLATNVHYKTADNKCLAYTVQNCATKEDAENKCATCADTVNWYINYQGECIPSHLNHCTALVANTLNDRCQTCADGFKLSAGQCFRLNIAGCLTYTAENCTSCVAGFYFDTSVCKPYTVSNCLTYDSTVDACATCLDGFNLASGKCKPNLIDFCGKYDTTAARTCIECEGGYYKNNLACLPQNVSGCLKYVPNKNECVECRVGFTWVSVNTCSVKSYLAGCMRLKPTDPAKCAICHRGYVQDPATLTCLVSAPAISDCIQYQQNTGKCEACSLGKTPNAAGTACAAITYTSVTGCLFYDTSTGNCKECEYGQYLSAKNQCSNQLLSNCEVYFPNKNECLQCSKDFYLRGGNCLAYPVIAHCLHYASDRLSCLVCDTDYYPEGQACFQNLLQNCSLKVRNKNQCRFCQENYLLGVEGDCQAQKKSVARIANCLQVFPDSEECKMCLPGYTKDQASGLCRARALTTSQLTFDDACVGNFSSEFGCDMCQEGNNALDLQYFLNTGVNTGCLESDPETGYCQLCDENYSFDANSATCTSVASPTDCKFLIPGLTATTALTVAAKCQQCIDTHHLVSKTCYDASSMFNYYSLSGTSSPVPTKCSPGKLLQSTDSTVKRYECAVMNADMTSPVSNCLAYSPAGVCVLCPDGQVFGTSCAAIPNYVSTFPTFTTELSLANKDPGMTASAVTVAQQINDTVFSPVRCSTANRMAVVTLTYTNASTFKHRTSYRPRTAGTADKTGLEVFPSYPKISCVAFANSFPFLTDSSGAQTIVTPMRNGTAPASTDCAFWMLTGSTYKCLRCYDGYIPIISFTYYRYDGINSYLTISPTGKVDFAYIERCQLPSGTQTMMKRAYQGLNYQNIISFPAGAFLSVDHCDHTSMGLVVLVSRDSLNQYNYTYSSHGFSGQSSIRTHQYCVNVYNTNFFSSTRPADKWSFTVTNCQINYFISTNNVQTPKFPNNNNFGCFACRPGYRPFTNATDIQYQNAGAYGAVAVCNLIAQCNQTAGTNTWMNACQTCNANHVWHYDVSMKFIQYHYCFAFQDSLNCKIGHSGKCVMCKVGYNLLSDGTCISRSNNAKKQCNDVPGSTNAYVTNNIVYDATDDTTNELTLVTFFFMQYLFQEMAYVFVPDCLVCATGHNLLEVPATTANYCTNNIYFTDWTASSTFHADCLYWNHADVSKCDQCAGTKVVVGGDYTTELTATCADYSARLAADPFVANCLVVQDATSFKCTKCKLGFEEKTMGSGGTAYKICYPFMGAALNCAKFDLTNEKCTICANNFVFDSTIPIWCKPPSPALQASDCSQPAEGGRCLQCKGVNYYPFHWKLKDPTADSDYAYKCIDQGRLLDNSFFQVIRSFDFNTNHQILDLTQIPYNFHYRKAATWTEYNALTTTGILAGFINKTHVCMKVKDSTNFADCTEVNNNGFKCSKCANGKAIFNKPHDFNECIAGCSVLNPLTQECEKCTDTSKFVSADRSNCSSSINVTFCNYKSRFADACIYCHEGYYMQSSQTCAAYTFVENCKQKDYYSDTCVLCNDGYFLQSNHQCVMHVMDHCRFTSSVTWGVCLACEPGYDLVLGRCVYVPPKSLLCKTRNADGGCASCFDGYSLTHDSCVVTYSLSEIAGCLSYDQHGYLCVECKPYLSLSNGHCQGNKIKNCKVLSEDESHCMICNDQFYLNGVTCAPRRRFNCLIFSMDTDQCLSCYSHSYISKGDCVGYTAQNCLSFNKKKDECVNCSENFYFDQHARKCLKNGVFNCQVRNHATNACFSCLPEYYLSNEGICIARTITNCAKYEPFADSCIDCSASHYLVEDSGLYNNPTPISNSTLLNSCKPHTILNCQSFHPRQDKCLVCSKGSYMSSNRGCLERTAFNCASWNGMQNACKSCPSGTYLEMGVCSPYTVRNCVAFHETRNACLACPRAFFLQDSNCVPYSISDCLNFATNKDRCVKCQPGFYLRNGLCKFVSRNNCATHEDDKNECSTCENGYYLQHGQCRIYTISCLDYSSSSNECLGCPSGQYLETNNLTCINYSVSNCATFSITSNTCETCVPSHYFSGGLCLPYTVTNCGVYHSLFNECVTCKSGYYHTKQWCLPYNVANCVQYSPVADICLSCQDQHYNLNGNCLPYTAENCATFQTNRNYCLTCASNKFYRLSIREDLYKCRPVSPVVNCKTYSDFADTCYECVDNFYLDEATNTCHAVPNTLANCHEFLDADNCKSCVAPYFLRDNLCLKTDHLISMCARYESNSKCAECEGANMLSPDATLCLKITEPSCETYADPSSCKTCAGNFVINYIDDSNGDIVSGLNGEDLSTRRAICNSSGIDNCVFSRRSFPANACLQCATDFFLASTSFCQPVTLLVPNCETYFANGVCAQCTDNHVLSFDKAECTYDLSFLGKNCQSGKFFAEPKCYLCQSGFYFGPDRDCRPCSMEGCAVCSAAASASCQLCKVGYYMNHLMQCLKNAITLYEENVEDLTSYIAPPPSSNPIFSRVEKEVADTGFDHELKSATGIFSQLVFLVVFVLVFEIMF